MYMSSQSHINYVAQRVYWAVCWCKVEERKSSSGEDEEDKMKSVCLEGWGGLAQCPYELWLQPETFNLDLI